MINRLIIGAPFGNYLSWNNATSTLGTYTVENRGGFWTRLWRVLKTVRYSRRTQSWINKLGLPNPGIYSLRTSTKVKNGILSIHGFNADEWDALVKDAVYYLHPLAIEFNISCPNVNQEREIILSIKKAIELCFREQITVIAKLPPIRWMAFAEPLFYFGVRHFHACNTIPTPGGGISGKPLKQYSLWAVEDLRSRFCKEIKIIGGGGITKLEDVNDYILAGADHVSIASMLFNPFNWKKIPKFIDFLAKLPSLENEIGNI